jgi:hypothetical protein
MGWVDNDILPDACSANSYVYFGIRIESFAKVKQQDQQISIMGIVGSSG